MEGSVLRVPRLDVLLSRNLGVSRRRVKGLLRAGRVTDTQGAPVDEAGLALPPTSLPQAFLIDGQAHVLHHRCSVLLNKPLGVVSAQRDARFPTAYACVRDAPLGKELRGVGRLDKDTSGLLLWTTDGTLLHRLTHPRYGVPRTYHAGLSGAFAGLPADFSLADGHRPRIERLEAAPLDAMHPALRRSAEASHHAVITIRSGRFHEVRRIFAALGSHVIDLCRVAYGEIALPTSLPAGQWVVCDLHTHFAGLSPLPENAD